MKIKLNGREYEAENGITIGSLLSLLEVGAAGTAVAINETIIPRDTHVTHIINEGDRVEVVRAIGGG